MITSIGFKVQKKENATGINPMAFVFRSDRDSPFAS